MASNYRQRGEAFHVPTASITPSTFSVGDPVRLGNIPAVAMTSSSNTNTTIWVYGVYELTVEVGSTALGIGDIIYFKETLATRNLTNAATVSRSVGGTPTTFHNVRWGYALQAASANSNANILVKVGW